MPCLAMNFTNAPRKKIITVHTELIVYAPLIN